MKDEEEPKHSTSTRIESAPRYARLSAFEKAVKSCFELIDIRTMLDVVFTLACQLQSLSSIVTRVKN
ncbi:hypothetical protein FA10DRAFT_51487 [Acaromyces ingoldii]|uniref:Uncharacterized protein n=1 Tax=Acaromyces ingoldii TaxID=215250 RepID=A0A316YA00_9BASI|nr:hypothetical protein FA10DRAFT_51487 [Acaromyces ingoldii]PWN86700.1 hypothetical protein FA10DRAFT_51487 [Acaromyces ingoldii]